MSMKTIFRYVYSLVIVFLSLGIFSSCSDMSEDGDLSAMSNSPIGDFGEIQPLTLVTPDNQVLENAFGHPAVFYGDDYKENCMQIFCLTFPCPSKAFIILNVMFQLILANNLLYIAVLTITYNVKIISTVFKLCY